MLARPLLALLLSVALLRAEAQSLPPEATLLWNSPSTGKVSWRWTGATPPGEYEFDIEWVFVEAARSVQPSQPFEHRPPIRAVLRAMEYALPDYFEPGQVFLRVRPVLRATATEGRIAGAWKQAAALPVATADAAPYVGLNWQRTTLYAAAGRRSRSITYFDGFQRPRQGQVHSDATGRSVVSETKYDREGRAALTVVPAPKPASEPAMRFSPLFNVTTAGAYYSPDLFLDDTRVPLDSVGSGSANYYSADNPQRAGRDAYLPDAGGFPFSTTEYENDESGRPRRKSGIGPLLQLGSNYESFHYYGGADLVTLKRLLGSSVTDPAHFKRDVVIDPNGQARVTYRDPFNNVVATALAGAAVPAALVPLPGIVRNNLQGNLAVADPALSSVRVRRSVTPIVITDQTAYTLNYSMSGIDYRVDPGAPFPLQCAHCAYRLEIKITKDGAAQAMTLNGATAFKGAPGTMDCQSSVWAPGFSKDTTAPTWTLARLICDIKNPAPLVCTAPAAETAFSVPGSTPAAVLTLLANLREAGTYEIDKTLTQLDGELNNDFQLYTNGSSTFSDSTYRTNHPKSAAYCAGSCEESCTAINNTRTYETPELKNNAKQTCIANCQGIAQKLAGAPQQCEQLRAVLLQDVSPGGFLFENPSWLDAHAASLTPACNGTGTALATCLTERWDPIWANTLLPGNKEKCHIDACERSKKSRAFDAQLMAISPADPGFNSCRFFPAGEPAAGTLAGAVSWTSSCNAQVYQDLYFSPGELGFSSGSSSSTPRAQLRQRLEEFQDRIEGWDPANGPISLWQFVARGDLHPEFGTTGILPVEVQWSLFRPIYMGLKAQLHAELVEAMPCPYQTYPEAHVKAPPSAVTSIEIQSQSADQLDGIREQYCHLRVADWTRRASSRCGIAGTDPAIAASEPGLRAFCEERFTLNCPAVTLSTAAIANDPALAPARAAMGACLGKLVEASPCKTETFCRQQCCAAETAVSCLERLMTALLKRLPAASGEVSFGNGVQAVSWNACDFKGLRVLLKQNVATVVSGSNECHLWFKEESNADASVNAITPVSALEAAASAPGTISVSANWTFTGYRFKAAIGGRTAMVYVFTDCRSRDEKIPASCRIVLPKAETCLDKARLAGVMRIPTASLPGAAWTTPFTPSCFAPSTHPFTSPTAGETCKVAQRPGACSHEILDRVDGIVALQQWNTAFESNRSKSCFVSLSMNPNLNRIGLTRATASSGTETCHIRLLDRSGTPILLGKIVDIVGDPYLGSLPAGFDASQAPGDSYTGISVQVVRRVGEASETITAYVFSRCAFDREDDCITATTALTFAPPPPPDDERACKEAVERLNDQEWRTRKDEDIREGYSRYANNYYNSCFSAASFNEIFTFVAATAEYHYTVLARDQAGNLTQTVPPAGIGNLGVTGNPHRMPTKYWYNGLNQLLRQIGPDFGERKFWHNMAGQLRFSQSAQQKCDDLARGLSGQPCPATGAQPAGTYQFIKYDRRGRPIQTGLASGISESDIQQNIDAADFPPSGSTYTFSDITTSIYDTLTGPGSAQPVDARAAACSALNPQFTRGRLAAQIRSNGALGDVLTCYSYDPYGNIVSILQSIPGLDTPKRMDYEYDAVSGKVVVVRYQSGAAEKLQHWYEYDADNRLAAVYTATDGRQCLPAGITSCDRDAAYAYYDHGPLARVEVGQNSVQGIDYAYTLQGWLKGVNRDTLDVGSPADVARDIGRDGDPAGANARFARDAFGFTLGYFPGDYKSIREAECERLGAGVPAGCWTSFEASPVASSFLADAPPLRDGSITRSVVANRVFVTAGRGVLGSAYQYDQLNRLTKARVHLGVNATTNAWPNQATDGSFDLTILDSATSTESGYDPNGNIVHLTRKGPGGAMQDNLRYEYSRDAANQLVNNRLQRLEAQPAGNYQYNLDGNLIVDQAAGITQVAWNVYGRVARTTSNSGTATTVDYLYDAGQNRVATIVTSSSRPGETTHIYLVRDDKGKPAARYVRVLTPQAGGQTAEQISVAELVLMGRTRLGVWRPQLQLCQRPLGSGQSCAPGAFSGNFSATKSFELTDHRGTVLSVVAGDRTALSPTAGASAVSEATSTYASDFYPYGVAMPTRTSSFDTYVFGYSGYERDDVQGAGNRYVTHARMYRPTTATWWSVDPLIIGTAPTLESMQEGASPYAFAANQPVSRVDKFGMQSEESSAAGAKPAPAASRSGGPSLAETGLLGANTLAAWQALSAGERFTLYTTGALTRSLADPNNIVSFYGFLGQGFKSKFLDVSTDLGRNVLSPVYGFVNGFLGRRPFIRFGGFPEASWLAKTTAFAKELPAWEYGKIAGRIFTRGLTLLDAISLPSDAPDLPFVIRDQEGLPWYRSGIHYEPPSALGRDTHLWMYLGKTPPDPGW